MNNKLYASWRLYLLLKISIQIIFELFAISKIVVEIAMINDSKKLSDFLIKTVQIITKHIAAAANATFFGAMPDKNGVARRIT